MGILIQAVVSVLLLFFVLSRDSAAGRRVMLWKFLLFAFISAIAVSVVPFIEFQEIFSLEYWSATGKFAPLPLLIALFYLGSLVSLISGIPIFVYFRRRGAREH